MESLYNVQIKREQRANKARQSGRTQPPSLYFGVDSSVEEWGSLLVFPKGREKWEREVLCLFQYITGQMNGLKEA